MTKFNDAGREIWFSRFMWSFYPAHWKGLAITVIGIGVTLSVSFLIDPDVSGLFIVPLIVGIGIMIWVGERHSPSRPRGS